MLVLLGGEVLLRAAVRQLLEIAAILRVGCVTEHAGDRERLRVEAAAEGRPLLRGVIHQVAFSVSLVVGTLLIVGADGAEQHVAAAVFAGSVAVCFGASALYHRIIWTPPVRLWMRRIDHAGVYR